MCAQCWTAAATAATGATGLRAYAAGRRPRWLTEARLKALSFSLIAAAICLATRLLSRKEGPTLSVLTAASTSARSGLRP